MAAVLELIIKGRDEFSGPVGKAQVSLGSMVKTGAAAALGFGGMAGAMLGAKQVIVNSIGAAAAYEHQMAQIRALTGATAEDTDLLKGSIREMQKSLPKSSKELGAGAYFILSSGITDVADAADVLKIAAKASTVGLGDTAAVADALTTVLNAYQMEAGQAGRVTDVLMQAVKDGKAEADAFAGVLGRVVPIASQMGISFEEVAANMATFTRLGVSAEEAATGLRGVMTQLLKPSEEAKELLAGVGLSMKQIREQVREKGLAVVLQDLIALFKGNEEAISTLFPDVRGLTNVLATAGVQADAYTEILGNMSTATGNLEKGFEEVSDTAQFKMQKAMNDLNVELEELGAVSLPAISFSISLVTESINDLLTPIRFVIDAVEWLDEALGGTDKAMGDAADTVRTSLEAYREMGASTGELSILLGSLAWRQGLAEASVLELAKAQGLSSAETKNAIAVYQRLDAEKESAIRANERFTESLLEQTHATAEIISTLNTLAGVIRSSSGFWTGMAAAAVEALAETGGAVQTASEQIKNNLVQLKDLTSVRTVEARAIDLQTNAMEKQAVAAQFALPAINAQIRAIEREISVLELDRAAIQSQIDARNTLTAATLEGARIVNLPNMVKQKELELARARILENVGGNVEDLTDADKDQIDTIDDQIRALQSSITVKQLEAEVTNLQREKSDSLSRSLEAQLGAIQGQIGGLQTQKSQLDLTAQAHQANISAIEGQITKLGLQRQAQDLVIEGWRLMAEGMLRLPTIADIGASLMQFKELLILQARQSFMGALASGDVAMQRQIWANLQQILAFKIPSGQHGMFIPPGVVTPAILHGGARGEAVIPLDRMPRGGSGSGGGGGMTLVLQPGAIVFHGTDFRDPVEFERVADRLMGALQRRMRMR